MSTDSSNGSEWWARSIPNITDSIELIPMYQLVQYGTSLNKITYQLVDKML